MTWEEFVKRINAKIGYFLVGYILGVLVTFGIVACSALDKGMLHVETIDGHEYVFLHSGGIVHKANCKGDK